MIPPVPARTVAATRRSLARRRLIVAALAVAAIASYVLAGWVAAQDLSARRLQHEGEQADATVVGIDAQPTGRGNFPNGSVIVRFEVAGRLQESAVYVGVKVTDYQAGQSVRVVYDPSDPSRVELAGVVTSGPGVPVVPPLAAGVLATVMAVVAGRHAHQIAAAIRDHPWTPVSSRLVQVAQSVALRQGSRTFVVLDSSRGEIAVEPIGLGRVTPDFEPEAWVAGVDRRTMALAAPGGGHVLAVRRRSAGRRSARSSGRSSGGGSGAPLRPDDQA